MKQFPQRAIRRAWPTAPGPSLLGDICPGSCAHPSSAEGHADQATQLQAWPGAPGSRVGPRPRLAGGVTSALILTPGPSADYAQLVKKNRTRDSSYAHPASKTHCGGPACDRCLQPEGPGGKPGQPGPGGSSGANVPMAEAPGSTSERAGRRRGGATWGDFRPRGLLTCGRGPACVICRP